MPPGSYPAGHYVDARFVRSLGWLPYNLLPDSLIPSVFPPLVCISFSFLFASEILGAQRYLTV